MPKLLLASAIVALTACAALLPVGCASRSDAGTEPSLGTSRAALVKGNLVISQVFGGHDGTVLNQDFVELFNPTAAEVDLAGSSLQVAAGAGDFTAAGTVVLTGKVPAFSYYLVAMRKATVGSAPSITKTPQATSAFDLGSQTGKAVIALQTDALECGANGDCDPADYIDLVGWGGSNQFEGAAITGLDAGNGAVRKSSCTDSNNNANDFVKQPPAPRAAQDAPATCGAPRDAGTDSGKPIPVVDPDPGEDPGDLDAGRPDAGRPNAVAASGDDDGCSVAAVGATSTSLFALVFAGAVAALARRRRRAS